MIFLSNNVRLRKRLELRIKFQAEVFEVARSVLAWRMGPFRANIAAQCKAYGALQGEHSRAQIRLSLMQYFKPLDSDFPEDLMIQRWRS